MIRDEDLDAAVAAGIVEAGQATRLRDLAARRQVSPATAPAGDPDEEKFRLIGGFSDVFVTIGVMLLAAALFGLADVLGFGQGFLFVGIVVAWGLAEVFSRHLKLALPSIVLAIMFAGSVGALVLTLSSNGILSFDLFRQGVFAFAFSGLSVAIASRLHDWRFRVPINGAITAAGLLAVVWAVLVGVEPRMAARYFAPISAVLGLAVFSAAMYFDVSDPRRATRRSDIAFWLHLLAAPLIVHPLISLTINGVSSLNDYDAAIVLGVFAVLALVAIVIDRRALLVSGLGYAGFAMAYLIGSRVTDQGLGLPLTLLGLAVVVLGLSAGWRTLRAIVVPLLPLGGLVAYLPPIANRDRP